MSLQNVLIVGSQLFANALSFLLSEDGEINVVDRVSSLEECSKVIKNQAVDTLVIAETLISDEHSFCELLAHFPEKTIIKANLENNQIEVMFYHQLKASQKELRTVLTRLPQN